MSRYMINQFNKLPIFKDYLLTSVGENEVKKRIISFSDDEKTLYIAESQHTSLFDDTPIKETNYTFNMEKKFSNYLALIAKPLFLLTLILPFLISLIYSYITVLKIERALTLSSFIISLSALIFAITSILYLLYLFLMKKNPSLKIVKNLENAYLLMYSLFLINTLYHFFQDGIDSYFSSSIVLMGVMSVYAHFVSYYCIRPLRFTIQNRIRFYRNTVLSTILLIEFKED